MKTIRRFAALALATPAAAQMPMPASAPACAQAVVVPGFEYWSAAAGSILAIGKPATLTLPSAASVNFSPALARPAPPGSFGGVFPLAIDKGGTYAIALGAGLWIDVILDGEKQAPVGHRHGAACSGIAKIVDFALKPGVYQVQLSEAKAASVKAMVIAR